MTTFVLVRGVLLILGCGAVLAFLLHTRMFVWNRVMGLGVFAGLVLYSGVGTFAPNTPSFYAVEFLVFLAVFSIAFKLFLAGFAGLAARTRRVLPASLRSIDSGGVWTFIIWSYIALHFVPLLYPELRLHQLISPPTPNLTQVFDSRWAVNAPDTLLRLADYGVMLLTPFFYIALYRYRNGLWRVLAIFAALLYLQYVNESYVGRGHVLVMLCIVALASWVYRPKLRLRLALAAVVLLPVFLIMSYIYGQVRIGGIVVNRPGFTGDSFA